MMRMMIVIRMRGCRDEADDDEPGMSHGVQEWPVSARSGHAPPAHTGTSSVSSKHGN